MATKYREISLICHMFLIEAFPLAGTQPNDPVLTNMFMYQSPNPYKHLYGNERLSNNDCFLRNMQKYKYIANFDDDEMIMPQNVSTWTEMMQLVKKQTHNKVRYSRAS